MGESENRLRYWLVESGPALEAAAEFHRRHDVFEAHRLAFIAKHQAQATVVHTSSHAVSLGGLTFAAPPDPAVWRERPGNDYVYYIPRKNTKAGKAIAAEMDAVHGPSNWAIGQLFLGHGALCTGFRMHDAGWERVGADWVVSARDVREAHEGYAHTWAPIPGLRELKASEYWAMVEAAETAKGQLAATPGGAP